METLRLTWYRFLRRLAAGGLIRDPIKCFDVDSCDDDHGRRHWEGQTIFGRTIRGSYSAEELGHWRTSKAAIRDRICATYDLTDDVFF